MRGGEAEANSGVEEGNEDTREEELNNDTDKSVGKVIEVRLPFLFKKYYQPCHYNILLTLTSKQKELSSTFTFNFVKTKMGEDMIQERIRMIKDKMKACKKRR
jgi:hypothetical protein